MIIDYININYVGFYEDKNADYDVVQKINVHFATSIRGNPLLSIDGKLFTLNRKIKGTSYWECLKRRNKSIKCNSRVVTIGFQFKIKLLKVEHIEVIEQNEQNEENEQNEQIEHKYELRSSVKTRKRKYKSKQPVETAIINQSNFIKNERGLIEVAVDGYRYSRRSQNGDKIYWYCKKRKNGKVCGARIATLKQTDCDDLHTIYFTKPIHAHSPEYYF